MRKIVGQKQLRFGHLNRGGGTKRYTETINLRDSLMAEGAISQLSNRGLRNDERAAIDDFLANRQIRRFPEADTGENWSLFDYLKTKGHKAYRLPTMNWNRAQHRFHIDGKEYSRDDFIAFVDALRAGDGLPPIGRVA